MPLLYIGSAWLLGTYLGAKVFFPASVFLSVLIPLCFLPFLPRWKNKLFILSLCLLAFFGAAFRYQIALPQINEHHLSSYNNQGTVEITGIISSDPETRKATQLFHLLASEIKVGDEKREVSGTALVRTALYPAYSYGDILKVTGRLETPQSFNDFDYKSYLERQGIFSILYYPKIEILDRGKGYKPQQWLYSFRNRLSQVLELTLPEPHGALARGITLGLRGDIPRELNEAFSRTGTAHLLAISGLHLSIVIGIFLSLGLWLFGKRYYLYIWLALLVTWLYALLTGMRPPIVRGAIMGSLFLLAEYLGRQRSAIVALVFAAAVMVGIKPQLLWDIAFQLSFLAMSGLVFLSPALQNWGRRWVSSVFSNKSLVSLANVVIDGFAITLSAIIATFPVIAYYFGIASLVGLPATFLALLALPGIILITMLISFSGLIFLHLAQILAWIDWLLLSYLILVVQTYDALPLAALEMHIPSWQVWCYYACLTGIIWLFNSRRQVVGLLSKVLAKSRDLAENAINFLSCLPKKWVIPSLVIIAILIWTVVLTMPDDRLHVSFLNVGQGDAILIQTPNRQNILIDGGPCPKAISLELSKKLPFWERTIDLVILTQPEADHITGLVEVLNRYKVKQILESGITSGQAIYQEWLRLISQKQINRNSIQRGQTINLGKGITIEVLNPPSPLLKGTADDMDNNGIVLRLIWGQISFLFTADIGEEAELNLIAQRANLRSTVLKVAHHGSRTSTSLEFLSIVDPEVAVISAGKNNKFGHPHPEVIDRLKTKLGENKIYSTAEDGTIEFITDGNKLWVKTERGYH